jgi:putative ABC transport system ATP-binding protein
MREIAESPAFSPPLRGATKGSTLLPAVRAGRVGFVFQAFNLLDALTVEETVLFPARLAPGGVRAARGHRSRNVGAV